MQLSKRFLSSFRLASIFVTFTESIQDLQSITSRLHHTESKFSDNKVKIFTKLTYRNKQTMENTKQIMSDNELLPDL